MIEPGAFLQNRYQIVRQLGQGGMGTVYQAKDMRLNNTAAIKEAHFTEERLRKQFEREAQLLAGLRHPSLPRVIDHFEEDANLFLVMDYVPGEDLWDGLEKRNSAFLTEDVLIWADQLLDALNYLHNQNPQIIHRDIKPQNLKVNEAGRVILLDFGLAKGFAGQVTSNSVFGYTPNYAPIEQIQGGGTDIRSDLYSLGATLYHLITNVLPPDVLSRVAATADGEPDPLIPARHLNPQIPPGVSDVLQQAMMIARNKRFNSAAEMRQALAEGKKNALSAGAEKEPENLPQTLIRSDQTRETSAISSLIKQTLIKNTPDTDSTPTRIRTEQTGEEKIQNNSVSEMPAGERDASRRKNQALAAAGGGILVILILSISFLGIDKIRDAFTLSSAEGNSNFNAQNSSEIKTGSNKTANPELEVSPEFWAQQREKAMYHPAINELLHPLPEIFEINFQNQLKITSGLKNIGYKIPLDFADLAELKLRSVLVELPMATQTYVLDVGGNVTDDEFTKFDLEKGNVPIEPDSKSAAALNYLARNFDGKEYDLSKPADRKNMRLRLLRMLNPQTRKVLEQISSDYFQKFQVPLRITSLTRPLDYQIALSASRNQYKPRNKEDFPPHTSGCAFDFSRADLSNGEQNFIMEELARLEREGILDAHIEGDENPVFHIFVFPE